MFKEQLNKTIIGRLFRIHPKMLKKLSNFRVVEGKVLADYKLDESEIKNWEKTTCQKTN
jgi:hypothetical protein